MRAVLAEFPRMPATVIAQRIGWQYSMTTLKDRVRAIRPEYVGIDPADVAAVQAICDGLTPEVIDALLRKWLARLPHPFTAADRAAGYRYQLSMSGAADVAAELDAAAGGCSAANTG